MIITIFIIIIIILVFSKNQVISFTRHLGSIKNRTLRYSKPKEKNDKSADEYAIYKELNMKSNKKGILSISLFGLTNPSDIDCNECTSFSQKVNMKVHPDITSESKKEQQSCETQASLVLKPGKSLYSCFKKCTGKTDKFYRIYLNYYIPLKNSIQKLRDYFPEGWYYRVYLERDTDPKIVEELISMDCEVIIMKNNSKGLRGTLWRFLPLEKGETFFSMEADHDISRNVFYTPHIPNYVNTFLSSNKPFIRFDQDITNILYPLSAPAWGSKNIRIPHIQKLMDKYDNQSYGDDEVFLAREIFPYFEKYGYTRVYNIVEIGLLIIVLCVIGIIMYKIIKK